MTQLSSNFSSHKQTFTYKWNRGQILRKLAINLARIIKYNDNVSEIGKKYDIQDYEE